MRMHNALPPSALSCTSINKIDKLYKQPYQMICEFCFVTAASYQKCLECSSLKLTFIFNEAIPQNIFDC